MSKLYEFGIYFVYMFTFIVIVRASMKSRKVQNKTLIKIEQKIWERRKNVVLLSNKIYNREAKVIDINRKKPFKQDN